MDVSDWVWFGGGGGVAVYKVGAICLPISQCDNLNKGVMERERVTLASLIEEGNRIKVVLSETPEQFGEKRLGKDEDLYYNWKELCIQYLTENDPSGEARFTKYAENFESIYSLKYLTNMIGVLMACKSIPSKKERMSEVVSERDSEIHRVEDLEDQYITFARQGQAFINSRECIRLFHDWHASACILFDKWFYPTEAELILFQGINGGGNGFVLYDEYNRVYSAYRVLLNRLKEGRNIKGVVDIKHIKEGPGGKPGSRISIFISYSHADAKWLDRLKDHLKVLSRYSEDIDYWEDTRLKGGDKWREEIEKAIEKANVAILLVSTAFLASDFIATKELPSILKKAYAEGTIILPLIVSPCAYSISELCEFQAINSPEKTLEDLADNNALIERTFLDLINQIRSLIVD